MSDDNEQEHKTMIKQLTDLDDHALDEQAGLFMHPRRKSLRSETTPRPLSQPFFQPLHVFPDVLSVSAMVERQEQKDHKEQQQQQQQQTKAQQQQSHNDNEPHTSIAENKSSGTISSMNAGNAQDGGGMAASLAQYPQSLALQPSRVGTTNSAGAETTADATPQPAAATASTRGNDEPIVAPPVSTAIKPRAGLRSVSLTRIAGERTDASATTAATSKSGGSGNVSGRDSTAGPDNRHSGKTGGIIGYHSAQTSDAPLNPPKTLRAGTPIETPTEEGDRQLSVETSRPNKAAGKRASNRRSANDRVAPAKTGRLFVRRVNASSRGSEEENTDDDEEQFIYRNSRSSLHVSSIPEDAYEDREPVGQSRRRTNRHRLSTYLGSIERRDSSGVGGALSTGGSYGQTYSSSTTAHGNSNSINYGASNTSSGGHAAAAATSGGGRAGGRRPGRAMRGGANGSSVNASVGFSSSGGGGAGGGAGHRFSILTQANNDYGGGTSEESDMDGEPAGLRSTYANQYSRRNSRRFQSNVYYGSSEDLPETTPLFRRHHGQQRKRKSAIAQVLRAAFLTLVLLASLFVLVILFNFTSAPLADVEAVRVSNILATEKELLFILHIQSTNPNIREVLIERAEIGVFAAAAISNNTTAQPDSSALMANETEPAILLGNVYKLSDPMRFAPGSLQKPTTDIKTTQISIHHPGATLGGGGGGDGEDDDSDASKWRRLLKGPYDLTVRGTLQYTLWQRNYAARICVAKLANLPPDNTTSSGVISYSIAAGLGCDEGDDDDTITLPSPPTPPFYLAEAVRRLPRLW